MPEPTATGAFEGSQPSLPPRQGKLLKEDLDDYPIHFSRWIDKTGTTAPADATASIAGAPIIKHHRSGGTSPASIASLTLQQARCRTGRVLSPDACLLLMALVGEHQAIHLVDVERVRDENEEAAAFVNEIPPMGGF